MNSEIENLIKGLSVFDVGHVKEMTIEVNPESFTRDKAFLYKSLGINRVSIGIQSFDDIILKKIGRLADLKSNLQAIEIAKSLFDNVSIDLIYGIPAQDIEKELDFIKQIMPHHISVYCLTISKGSLLYKNRKSFKLNDRVLNRQFIEIHKFLKKIGYRHYEVSNYSFKGKESVHNINYWQRGFYIGLGAGASGFISYKGKEYRYINERIKRYISKLEKGVLPVKNRELIDERKKIIEKIMLGLRTVEGIPIDFLSDGALKKVKYFIESGYCYLKNNRLIVNFKGWCILDYIVSEIVSLI